MFKRGRKYEFWGPCREHMQGACTPTPRIRSGGLGTAGATPPPVAASWPGDKAPLGLGEMPRPQRRPHLEVEAQGSTERLGTLRDWSHGGEGDPRRQRGDMGTDSRGVPARLPVEAEGHSLPGPPAVLTRGASGSGPGAARGCEAGPCLEARGACAL